MFSTSTLISGVPGLPPATQYLASFIQDVRLQGSGQTRDGQILHYDGGGKFSIQNCPRTASGACAVDGQTVAVDRNLVPFKATVAFRLNDSDHSEAGLRVAQDTGGGIAGRHIDIYFGTRRTECNQWGKRPTGEVELVRLR